MLFLLTIAVFPVLYYTLTTMSSDVGILKCKKGKLTINTTSGPLRVAQVTLPSYDWDVHFFTADSGFNEQDGLHDSSVIDNHGSIPTKTVRNILVCEHLYPEDLGKGVKCVMNSPFDDVCYVKTLEPRKPIDYRAIANEFEVQMEQM